MDVTSYIKKKSSSSEKRKFALREYGYTADGTDLPEEYLVKVTSLRNAATVVGAIQEDIFTKVESRWEPFIPVSMLQSGNILTQALTGGRKSLITKATSRRIWTGSSPMTLSLVLRFESIFDSYTNVVEPCRILQSIALPSGPSGGIEFKGGIEGIIQTIESLPRLALAPPGPTPFTTEGILNIRKSEVTNRTSTEIVEGLGGGDSIMVELGRFLTFYNVIIKEVSVHFPPRFDPKGNPVSAKVSIIFETYEMITTQELDRFYGKETLSLKEWEDKCEIDTPDTIGRKTVFEF